jgi:GNAT superfamily N-acetyltransferase
MATATKSWARNIEHGRRLGFRLSGEALRRELWSERNFFELRCDLTQPAPPPRRAQLDLTMQSVEAGAFRGFDNELEHASRTNHLNVLLLTWYCRASVETLYVGTSDGRPAYAQWLVKPGDEVHIPRGRYPKLEADELLLEGAYTFEEFRGLGLMTVGMGQLVQKAREAGASTLVTYVDFDNVPSLRGCANVGFAPALMRTSRHRVGLGRWTGSQLDSFAQAAWRTATGQS